MTRGWPCTNAAPDTPMCNDEPGVRGGQVTCHPLLWRARQTAMQEFGHVRVQCLLNRPPLAYLWDHAVQGRPILPAAALCEMALAASKVCPACISAQKIINK